ncbi:uncharacterized protein LOC127870715 [Dreissena polymorpha]|uniref:uncharacterized protein LOC127870715 n=1 Tax=Dreissena polymorpha TaxID=45954 RepID=UPI002264B85F|nr:uncharacterized protein LOC127870715 [Dreissena polymorpha]
MDLQVENSWFLDSTKVAGHHKAVLLLRIGSSTLERKVAACTPQTQTDIMFSVHIGDEMEKCSVPLDGFLPTSYIFAALHQTVDDSVTFSGTLTKIMTEASLSFFDPASTPARHQLKYKCSFKFPDRVRVMRNLHPHVSSASDVEKLDTSNRPWRRKCEEVMGFTGYGSHSQFGGVFKEALACASLSRRCYRLFSSIIVKHQDLHVSVTANMYRGVAGAIDEQFIFNCLRKVDDCEMSLADMNSALKKDKQSTRGASEDIGCLRTEISSLKRQLREKDEALKEAREQLWRLQELRQDQQQTDVYSFIATPLQRRCNYSRPVYAPSESEDEETTTTDRPPTKNFLPSESEDEESTTSAGEQPPTDYILKLSDSEDEETTNTDEQPPTKKSNNQPKELSSNNKTETQRSRRNRHQVKKLVVGQAVSAKYRAVRNGELFEEWFEGTIVSVMLSGEKVKVKFEDGCERVLGPQDIKLL